MAKIPIPGERVDEFELVNLRRRQEIVFAIDEPENPASFLLRFSVSKAGEYPSGIFAKFLHDGTEDTDGRGEAKIIGTHSWVTEKNWPMMRRDFTFGGPQKSPGALIADGMVCVGDFLVLADPESNEYMRLEQPCIEIILPTDQQIAAIQK